MPKGTIKKKDLFPPMKLFSKMTHHFFSAIYPLIFYYDSAAPVQPPHRRQYCEQSDLLRCN